jgi:uncharacterized phage protein (TIGR01671 family)
VREILFRGKRIDNGEWVYGNLNYGTIGIKSIKDSYYISDFDVNPWDKKFYPVINESVGQYTGLTDKNGNKIFWGDIVRLFDIAVGEIVQECGAFGIGCRKQIDYDYLASEIAPVTGTNNTPMFCYNDNYVSLWELYWNYNEEDDNISVIEVIGNIHDNPELLEVKE